MQFVAKRKKYSEKALCRKRWDYVKQHRSKVLPHIFLTQQSQDFLFTLQVQTFFLGNYNAIFASRQKIASVSAKRSGQTKNLVHWILVNRKSQQCLWWLLLAFPSFLSISLEKENTKIHYFLSEDRDKT